MGSVKLSPEGGAVHMNSSELEVLGEEEVLGGYSRLWNKIEHTHYWNSSKKKFRSNKYVECFFFFVL